MLSLVHLAKEFTNIKFLSNRIGVLGVYFHCHQR